MGYETLSYQVVDGVGHLRFTPPGGVTVVNPAFARDFRDVMIEIEFDESARAVAVTADGKVFSAGGDLKYFSSRGDDLPSATAQLIVDLHDGLYRMNRMPKVFVAGIRGAAGGAGLSMVGAFDLVVSGRSTRYTMAYTQAGLSPDATSTYFIARHIGLRRMLELTLTNRVLAADEAQAWGLVNQVVDDDAVDDTATALATRLATGATFAIGRAKQVVYHGIDAGLEAAGAAEGAGITAAMQHADAVEGIAAFVEKRPPAFDGR